MFLDPDNLLPEHTIEDMLNIAYASNTDLLQGSWYDFLQGYKKKSIRLMELEGIIDNNRNIVSVFPWENYIGILYKKFFQLPEGYWFEDAAFSFILSALPCHIAVTKKLVYGYRINQKEL